ncbi:MAG: hypothetical protein FWF97_04970 [Alphaproteobacteria bacterium]|nr:hypothetical protein [Alphaproteobacteria bacterium]
MKTKIVYISGGEAFDVAEVRGAFDEVRKALGLGEDTVLFGVPVDSDGVAVQSIEHRASSFAEATADRQSIDGIEEVAQKPKRARKQKAEKIEINEYEPAITPDPEEPERVIPILSVLSGGKLEPEALQPVSVKIAQPDVAEEKAEETLGALDEDLPEPEPKTPKTIEDIFENLTPLAQEKIIENPRSDLAESRDEDLDDDATLTRLAAEFVETCDVPEPAPAARGARLGKLKNILPFKKAKKDESSVLGDLFGWAGIAANEDDIQAPSFFRASN